MSDRLSGLPENDVGSGPGTQFSGTQGSLVEFLFVTGFAGCEIDFANARRECARTRSPDSLRRPEEARHTGQTRASSQRPPDG